MAKVRNPAFQLQGSPDNLVMYEAVTPSEVDLHFSIFVGWPVALFSLLGFVMGWTCMKIFMAILDLNSLPSIPWEVQYNPALLAGLLFGSTSGFVALFFRVRDWQPVQDTIVTQHYTQQPEEEPVETAVETIPVSRRNQVEDLPRQLSPMLVAYAGREHTFPGKDVNTLSNWVIRDGMRNMRKRPTTDGRHGWVELKSVTEDNYQVLDFIFQGLGFSRRAGNNWQLTDKFYTEFNIPLPSAIQTQELEF